jgi:hypothetical protein
LRRATIIAGQDAKLIVACDERAKHRDDVQQPLRPRQWRSSSFTGKIND